MLLMQYRFDFADDHDMGAVRERISAIAPGFNSLGGLVHKAFLVSSLADGSSNRYAPFYVWKNDEAMRAFLVSDAFARVCAKYGRPKVRAWIALHSKTGSLSKIPVRATQEFIPVEPSSDLAVLAAHEQARADVAARDGSLHSIHIGLDTTTWQLVRMYFWHHASATKQDVDAYDIEYLAFPRMERLSA
jgi:Domain of unknown function (DUF4865)